MTQIVNFHKLTLKQQIERWQKADDLLAALTPHERRKRRKHWDMSWWGFETDCGTVGCAAGLCSFNPWFVKRGLKPIWSKEGRDADGYLPESKRMIKSTFYSKVKAFFGNGAEVIFANPTTRSPGQVRREIQLHIEILKLLGAERPRVVAILHRLMAGDNYQDFVRFHPDKRERMKYLTDRIKAW